MRTVLHIDDSDILPVPLPDGVMGSLKIGDTVTVNYEPYEVWYIEEVGNTHRNVRVQRC